MRRAVCGRAKHGLRGRGMGCVAARDIDRGERLVAEAPLTVEGGHHTH